MKLPAYRELSKEQDAINNLPLDESYLITGPPGTGKTVMAIYRAEMISQRKQPVSLLMHSRLLSQYTENAVKKLKIEGVVNTFTSWINAFYRSHYGTSVPSFGKYDYDWNGILQRVGSNRTPKERLEYLLIDEGQDIDKRFYPVARFVARYLTVFADENQRITDRNSTLSEIATYGGFSSTHRLTRNYRNTREIAELAAHFFTGLPTGIAELPTRSGEKPSIRALKNLHETVEFIARYERNHPAEQIGVFVHFAWQRESLVNRLSVAGRTKNPVQVFVGGRGKQAESVNFESPGITVLCYSSAKGLEFDTVFLPELQAVPADINSAEFKMRFYVLTSRARESLYLLYSGEGPPRILDAFPPHLVEAK